MSNNQNIFITQNAQVKELLELAKKFATTDYPILILGETGTGKELLTRIIHENSRVKDGPLVIESVGAIPDTILESELFGYTKGAFSGASDDRPGVLQSACGGTLYLDGIEEASSHFQVNLLRFLQNGAIRPVGASHPLSINLRLISSTTKNLKELRTCLREDFFQRIGTLQLELPPLRKRKDDIDLLTRHFLQQEGYRQEVPPELSALLTRYSWPGNIRELKNEIIQLLYLNGDQAEIKHLSPHLMEACYQPSELDPASSLDLALQREERRIILETLQRNRFNRTRTARELKVSRTWLYQKMHTYRLKVG